jgi:hypothetical protein
MSIFSDILEKLGLKKPAPTAAPTPTKAAPKPQDYRDSRPLFKSPATGVTPAVTPIRVVDVVAKLEKLAATNPQKLDWKVSIVDLLKLLGIDSSLASRKELAVELGCPAGKMADSAQMNMWLHKTVLQKIAANGGNIPKQLLD